MPRKVNIEIGEKFGELIIVKELESTNTKRRKRQFLCRCSCGNEIPIVLDNLRSGHTKSCGCIKAKNISDSHKTHGLSHTRIYAIWNGIIQRCKNENYHNYLKYGKKGIQICSEWLKFENFYNWSINNGYTDKLSIDRKDFNGNYEPSNCRWVDDIAQANNKSNNVKHTYKNFTGTISEICTKFNSNTKLVTSRIYQGFTIEEAIETIKGGHRK